MMPLELPDRNVVFSIVWLFLVVIAIGEQKSQVIAKIYTWLAQSAGLWTPRTVKIQIYYPSFLGALKHLVGRRKSVMTLEALYFDAWRELQFRVRESVGHEATAWH